MYVTNPRASAWLDPELVGGKTSTADNPAHGRCERPVSQVRYAAQPLRTSQGRCIALKLVASDPLRTTPPRFFVLFESRYERSPRPRWLPLERVLSEAEVARWLAGGFQR